MKDLGATLLRALCVADSARPRECRAWVVIMGRDVINIAYMLDSNNNNNNRNKLSEATTTVCKFTVSCSTRACVCVSPVKPGSGVRVIIQY